MDSISSRFRAASRRAPRARGLHARLDPGVGDCRLASCVEPLELFGVEYERPDPVCDVRFKCDVFGENLVDHAFHAAVVRDPLGGVPVEFGLAPASLACPLASRQAAPELIR